jgi:N-acyl-L-homoserine lactone synthetase
MIYQSVYFSEGGYVVKNIERAIEKEQAFHLRHETFCKRLRWVNASSDGQEIDDYDNYSISLGLFEREELIGMLRIISSIMPMMIEKEFSALVSPFHIIRKNTDTVEVTRLCLRKNSKKHRDHRRASEVIYKGLYLWSLLNDVRFIYLAVNESMYRRLKIQGFIFQSIGPSMDLGGGVKSIGALLDWRKLEEKSLHSEGFLNRDYIEVQSLRDRVASV